MDEPKKLLLVEKNEEQRRYFLDVLSGLDLDIKMAASISEATSHLSQEDFSILLVDFISQKDKKNGLFRNLKLSNPRLGIVLLTEKEKAEYALSLLRVGIVDHIVDPDNPASIFSAIHNELEKEKILRKNDICRHKLKMIKVAQQENSKRASDLEEIYDTTLENLMTALDLRDVETFGHSKTVAKYSQMLAHILGIKDKVFLDNIRKGALLHDVGKIAIPDSILKKTTPLTAEEWKKIKLHPSLGYGLIKEIKLLKVAGNIILYHHERYDGNGYPKGLKKEEIPIEARIFALADALDAITSYRPYREKRDFVEAHREINANSKTQFDPEVVKAFSSLNLNVWEKVRLKTTKLIPSFIEKKMNETS